MKPLFVSGFFFFLITQIFNENAHLVPVPVIDVKDNVVLQQKTLETIKKEGMLSGVSSDILESLPDMSQPSNDSINNRIEIVNNRIKSDS